MQSRHLAESISSYAVQVKVSQPLEHRYKSATWLTSSSALVGTVEELSASQETLNLVRDQFEVNYFGPLNIIKAALPHMRRESTGHIMIISGISKPIQLVHHLQCNI